jgi:hypothetical protein
VISKWILDQVQKRRESQASQQAGPPGAPQTGSKNKQPRVKPPNPTELAQRLEILRGLCFCALFDLCSWLAGAHQAVPEQTREYSLTHIREVPDPRQRMQYYINPQLLAMWDQALQPYFTGLVRMAPELGDSAQLREEGLDKGMPTRVELRFNNRSSLVAARQPRQPMPREEWALTLWVSADLTRIDDACLRPVEPQAPA